MINNNEEVYVLPSHNLYHIDHGFTWSKHDKNIWTKFDKLGKYVYHDEAEGIYVLQQLIPYIIIKNELGQFLTYNHPKNDVKRTSEKMSIGFERHITPQYGLNNVLFKSAVDALMDSGSVGNITSPLRFSGYVRDNSEGNADHIGCVFIFDCFEKDTNINPSEVDKTWLTKDELITSYHKFDSWSKFIIDYLVDNDL